MHCTPEVQAQVRISLVLAILLFVELDYIILIGASPVQSSNTKGMQLRSIMQPVFKLYQEWVPAGPPLLKLSFPAEYNESYIPLVRDACHLTCNRF